MSAEVKRSGTAFIVEAAPDNSVALPFEDGERLSVHVVGDAVVLRPIKRVADVSEPDGFADRPHDK